MDGRDHILGDAGQPTAVARPPLETLADGTVRVSRAGVVGEGPHMLAAARDLVVKLRARLALLRNRRDELEASFQPVPPGLLDMIREAQEAVEVMDR